MDFECNNCKENICISEHEIYELYDKDEGLHDLSCPYCDEDIYVRVIVDFSFKVCDEEGDEIY